MFERKITRNGKTVTEVRSQGGKLLYIKTEEGYEMKCPRTKQICLVRYDQMLFDCLKCFNETEDEAALQAKTDEIKKQLVLR